jgi:CelD/BcsL family acetyltransferase involved in cellulose biosynthesis
MTVLDNTYAGPVDRAYARLEPTLERSTDVARPAAASALGVSFEIVSSRAGFAALEAEWNSLFALSGMGHQIFQSFNWNWHWAQSFLDGSEGASSSETIVLLTGRRGGQLVTLWPMVMARRGLLKELAWMGEPVSQYGDVLLDQTLVQPTEVLQAGWDYLCRTLKPDLARLRKVRADAAIAPLLDMLSSLHTAELEAPFIDLTKAKDFAAYEERFPNRARRNRRRQMRRLEEAGTVTFKHLDEGAEASALAASAIELKRQWLIDRGYVSPALADARMARFMTAVATGDSHSTATRVSALQAGEKTAALQIGFTAHNTRVLHVIVYDRAFEKMAAGVLHLEEAIRHGFDENLDRIDLLAPAASYKLDWADGTVPVIDHAIGLSPKGRAYARIYLGYLRGRLKSTVERLPLKVRQILVTTHLRTTAKRLMALCGVA